MELGFAYGALIIGLCAFFCIAGFLEDYFDCYPWGKE